MNDVGDLLPFFLIFNCHDLTLLPSAWHKLCFGRIFEKAFYTQNLIIFIPGSFTPNSRRLKSSSSYSNQFPSSRFASVYDLGSFKRGMSKVFEVQVAWFFPVVPSLYIHVYIYNKRKINWYPLVFYVDIFVKIDFIPLIISISSASAHCCSVITINPTLVSWWAADVQQQSV